MIELNKIYNEDCLVGMARIPDSSVDMILCDPPYGINYLSHRTDNHHKLQNDSLADWLECLPLWLAEMQRVIRVDGCCCCCCGGGKTPVTALFTIEAIKFFNLIQTLVWEKTIGLGWKYRPAYENILVLSKSKDNYKFYDTSNSLSNVIKEINQIIPSSNEHPTQKPVRLMQRLLNIHSSPNDIILDPFMGSGTTAIACIRSGRQFIGFETDKQYYENSLKRIENELSKQRLNFGE